MRLAVVILIAAVTGCDAPELGEAPFYCNNGVPECPDGYRCVQVGAANLCLREGVQPLQPDIAITQPDAALKPDQRAPAVDQGPSPDRSIVADSAPAADKGVTPDQSVVVPADSGPPPHLGCQNNAECGGDSPCCCPLPVIPGVWGCLPICINPICFG